MKTKQFLKDYFYFNRKERLGLLALLLMIGLAYVLPLWFPKREGTLIAENNLLLVKALDTVTTQREVNDASHYVYEPSARPEYSSKTDFTKGELFSFDPNTLDIDGWQRLGLREKTARTIDKYRSKGGKFYKPEDVQKIWGLPDGFYDRVKEYIHITPIERSFPKNDYVPYVREERKPSVLNINEADTSAFIALPGIGGKLAARIVSFRDKLGGFYAVEQIAETYGVPDSTFQKLRSRFVVGGEVKKLNINTATKEDLKIHPYIRWQLGNAIVEYRNQHGEFKSLEELKKIALVDEGIYQKITHYLSL